MAPFLFFFLNSSPACSFSHCRRRSYKWYRIVLFGRLVYFLKIKIEIVPSLCDHHAIFFFFLINCWSSAVASVVLPQLCNLHCQFCCGSGGREMGKGERLSSARSSFRKRKIKREEEKNILDG